MRNVHKTLTLLALAGAIGFQGVASWARVTAEDQKLIEAAGCEEIIKEYRNFTLAERKVKEDIQRTSSNTTASNILGVATLATFGIGFFHWNDQVDARENLAELTAYREAIYAEGKKKKCDMPVL